MSGSLGIRVDYADDDLQRRVANFLHSQHFPAFKRLHVEVQDGAVTVLGTVDSFYEKQVALSSCQRVAGVLALIDQIAVTPASSIVTSAHSDGVREVRLLPLENADMGLPGG
ncbi:MAG TPA: BON domain-containing protein [Pirellulaceae bacterium]|nr:BON domain-containing protein [Pirellulaceae bacterium]